MTSTQACETPMSDHVERFWQTLSSEHVRILIDIRRDHDEGQPPHWDSASFSNDVAKALVADRLMPTVAQAERVWHRKDCPFCGSPDGQYSASLQDLPAAFFCKGCGINAAQPPAAPVETCKTCNGRREVGGFDRGDNAYRSEPCPECSPQRSSAGTADETGWLIEKDDPPVYCILSDDYDEHWTPDANKALRFARREDAQAYSDHTGWTSPPVRVVDHAWPALEPMPRGGMKVDWWEQSVLYRRRLRALMKLVEKEGYSVSSDGRNGTPMALVRTRDEPQGASMREALSEAHRALMAFKDAVIASDKMKGREYVGLGIQVNDAIDKARLALSSEAPR